MSNCMMSKIHAITKICRCAELTDTLNTRWKRFIMIIKMLRSFEIFTSCQGSMQNFSKHYSKCKTVSVKFRKTLEERRLPIIKFWQDNLQNNFLNILTSKNIFITLQYSGDVLGILLKQTFMECSLNILETLLRDYWNLQKDQHLSLSNHTVLTQKQLFHWELLKKSFPLNCSLNVPWMSWGNTQQILHAGWEKTKQKCILRNFAELVPSDVLVKQYSYKKKVWNRNLYV